MKQQLRTFFFRCEICGSELVHTLDLNRFRARWWQWWRPVLPQGAPFPCHCGGRMLTASIPRLVMPEPGGRGEIWEVMPMDDEPVSDDERAAVEARTQLEEA